MDSILIITLVYIIKVNGVKIENVDQYMYMDHIAPPYSYSKIYQEGKLRVLLHIYIYIYIYIYVLNILHNTYLKIHNKVNNPYDE